MEENIKRNEKSVFYKQKCEEVGNQIACGNKCPCCYISMEESNQLRRCFMTGEYCSQQSNIQKRRNELHEKKQIMAFVIMNFSNMSDVVYKWRIRRFVKSLSKYLYIDKKKNRLYCSGIEKQDFNPKDNIKKVKSIHVVRADSEPASSYVICNCICLLLLT